MSELLPTVHADRIQDSITHYLTTTFALTDGDAQNALDTFLSDPGTGMFKGPYVRLRLPFRAADPGWRDHLEWYGGFDPPYGHQAAAFARLASLEEGRPRRPLPTLVTTGTGSGKTEAFLYPILDHVLRARRDGISGTKALILYPMNALANDQALRLTQILTGHPELSAITAALYTGQAGPQRTRVSADGLITDRQVIRDEAPDILLTNYKMLDQLLLRPEDQDLWRQSALSLQYLVLDEFHTYDGAQGTDVAMLLRRLGLALKAHWPADVPQLTDEDRARPLGRITPVATSATLGGKGDPGSMLGFAETIFGEPFPEDAVVTESRLDLAEWVGDAEGRVRTRGLTPVPPAGIAIERAVEDLASLGDAPDGAALARIVLGHLYDTDATDWDPAILLDAVRAHPLVQDLARHATDAVSVRDLSAAVSGATTPELRVAWETFTTAVVAALGRVRATVGRDALSVDVHLWVRELTRIDRLADSTARFLWSDDGPPTVTDHAEEHRPPFPALFCRHCGRSGWGIELAPVGWDLAVNDANIRVNHMRKDGRFRALLHAPAEADQVLLREQPVEGLMFWGVRGRTLMPEPPADDDPELTEGWVLPVLTTTGEDADKHAREDVCPSCGQEDGIRFLGSAVATLLSVSLSTLFGTPHLDPAEKKALVFTDSVQDAAHRAGFVQARSHTLTLRGVLRDAVVDGALSLDALVEEVIRRAGDDPAGRYRILAPDCADRPSFTEFWQADGVRSVSARVRNRVRRRLLFDAAMEFGLNSRTGRTLELTGAVAAQVDAGHPARLVATARTALQGFALQGTLEQDAEPDDATLVRWVRGVLERLRTQGAIDHPWFETYRREDGARWSIWGGRPKVEGMPAFPAGRPAPMYARVGGSLPSGKESGLDPVTSPQSWYARWATRVLPVGPADGGRLTRLLLDRLAHDGILSAATTASGASVYGIPPAAVVVVPTREEDLAAGRHLLVCSVCRAHTPGTTEVVSQLTGAPCLLARCLGVLEPAPLEADFYRRLYASPDMRRVVAREHTSLLDDATRLRYEEGFKGAQNDPQAPNVLVATPTLELGIDIGDLSAVLLASLPRTVASYVQRVGRAGRLTGNSLTLAYVLGRGEHLPKLGDPLSIVNGAVRPPATYLTAEEILRRQLTAHVVDRLGREPDRAHPRTAAAAMAGSGPDTFLGDLIALAEQRTDVVDGFLDTFADHLDANAKDALRAWVHPTHGPGTSGLAAHLHEASGRWQRTVETLQYRAKAIEDVLPELEAKKSSPAATDDDERAFRSARTAKRLTQGQLAHLRTEYWIAVLEEYGILPNYTLLDDAVTLDVGLSWIDPDSGDFQTEHAQFQRASAQAIRELAPGATFYARGWEILVDAVDLGIDGENVRTWAFCPACGYAEDVALGGTERTVATCPRCGATGIADTGQRVDVLELVHVTAEVRRDEVAISDRKDERDQASFQVFAIADVDAAQVPDRWYVQGNGFGCAHLRSVVLRWLNVGKPGHGASLTIAGQEHAASLFRVCSGCGKLDTETGRNRPHEHRPWCRYRTAAEENTRTIMLSRTLRTQGLLLRLPTAVTAGDSFAVPSLAAAVLLGLREHMGGDPDHLRVEHAVEPSLAGQGVTHEGLLVHDVVPGGTGYLSDLAGPEALRQLLATAWQIVRDCPCADEDRLACHRCLLPYAPPAAMHQVSRVAAERHLRTLLDLPEDAPSPDDSAWAITEVPPEPDDESVLEQRFRTLMRDRLTAVGAALTEHPGPTGNTFTFTLPGSPRRWTLTPQVLAHGSKPDFVLQSTDTTIPRLAIFVDGRRYHASVQHNRLADDATKRATLRAQGYLVVGVTARDIDEAENGTVTAPPWYTEQAVMAINQHRPLMASRAAYEDLAKGPVDRLIAWVTDTSSDDRTRTARAVPFFLTSETTSADVADDVSLAEVATRTLVGEPVPDGGRRIAVWRRGALAAAIEFRSGTVGGTAQTVADLALVLDDRDEVFGPDHADAWRLWLRTSNVLSLRDWPTEITTTRAVIAERRTGESLPTSAVEAVAAQREDRARTASEVTFSWPREWQLAYQDAEGAERELVRQLAVHEWLEAPVIGLDGPDGAILDLAWPGRRVVVDFGTFEEQDRVALDADGWAVVPPDADTLLAALRDARPTAAPGTEES